MQRRRMCEVLLHSKYSSEINQVKLFRKRPELFRESPEWLQVSWTEPGKVPTTLQL
jgi:hypothetical protein